MILYTQTSFKFHSLVAGREDNQVVGECADVMARRHEREEKVPMSSR
jgi:hypothetical protein